MAEGACPRKGNPDDYPCRDQPGTGPQSGASTEGVDTDPWWIQAVGPQRELSSGSLCGDIHESSCPGTGCYESPTLRRLIRLESSFTTGFRMSSGDAGIIGTKNSPFRALKTLGKDRPAGDDGIVGQKCVSAASWGGRDVKQHQCHDNPGDSWRRGKKPRAMGDQLRTPMTGS